MRPTRTTRNSGEQAAHVGVCDMETCHDQGVVALDGYAGWAVQFSPSGGQFDLVWLFARTRHEAYVWCGEPHEIKETTHPNIYYHPILRVQDLQLHGPEHRDGYAS